MTSLIMVRHAHSPFVFGQECSRGLSEQGEKDAKKTTEILSGETIHGIVSSPYKRAIQTVEGLANERGLVIQLFEELKERRLKGSYKLSEDEIDHAIKRSFDDQGYALEGGESLKDVQHRAIPLINDLLNKYKGQTVVLGTHGNIMTIIMNYFDTKYDYEFWKTTTKPDIYKLEFHDLNLHSVERLWKK
ncbi:MAG TPA: histidine phosphatase family protein [Sporolactobacillaceae bacterium]|nr:histidine phosphatase family protein [Sporolactobacillaceae bacterium]